MSNVMYDRCKKALGLAEVNWETSDIKASAVGAGYTYDDAHLSFADLTDVLDTVDVDDRAVADNGDWSCGDLIPGPVVAPGDTMQRVIFWYDSGTPSTSWLLIYCDRNSDLTPIYRAGTGTAVVVPFPAAVFGFN